MDFAEQSEGRPSASRSSIESQFTHVFEPETWFQLCILTLCLKIRSKLAKYPIINFPFTDAFFPSLAATGPFPYP